YCEFVVGTITKIALIVAGAFNLLLPITASAQTPGLGTGNSFVLHFAHDLDMKAISITLATGVFGASTTPVQTSAGIWDYAIASTLDNEHLNIFKVAINAPGYETQALDLSSLVSLLQRDIHVELAPLPKLSFAGRIESIAIPAGSVLRVVFYPGWQCEFFVMM